MSNGPLSNDALFERACRSLPGGVNSPVRAFRAVGGTPRFIASGQGSRVVDCEGKSYVDFIGSWGPMILGHCPDVVVEAIERQLRVGMSYGAPTELEIEMAELVCAALPSVEMVRFVSSGTEATMSAIRLARAATGRDQVIKFEGCYHGHGDAFLAQAGSGLATFGEPSSPGVPARVVEATLNARYNDAASVRALFEANPDSVAAVIVEPVVGNMGCVPPERDFLPALRALCDEFGALLIFDEVMTGFRLSYQGVQGLLGVRPDITCLGKVIGGGLPVGAYGGSRNLMERIAPVGPVYQAGTLSGNPLAMAAGLAQLRFLGTHPEVYDKLEADGARIMDHVANHVRIKGYPVTLQRVGSMGTVFFSPNPIRSYDDAKHCDTAQFAKYFWAMMEQGYSMPPSQFEAWFHSAAHMAEEISGAAEAICTALDEVFC